MPSECMCMNHLHKKKRGVGVSFCDISLTSCIRALGNRVGGCRDVAAGVVGGVRCSTERGGGTTGANMLSSGKPKLIIAVCK